MASRFQEMVCVSEDDDDDDDDFGSDNCQQRREGREGKGRRTGKGREGFSMRSEGEIEK